MAITSAAEAKLDARIRPEITALRSRTPYPKRRTSASVPGAAAPAHASETPRHLRAVVTTPPVATARVATGRTPIRLTKRGRIVVGTLIVIGAAAAVSLIWLALASQAQASSQVKQGVPVGRSLLRVVVRPGQTLWGIAGVADPGADPRAVIPQIMELNSLRGSTIKVGQVLWVPKG